MNGRQVKTFIGIMTLAALAACGYAGFRSHAPHGYLALAILVQASITSRMKVKLPGINGNMSVNLPFLLIGVANLSAAEVIVVTSVSTLVQCWPRKDAHFDTQRTAFNLSMMVFASSLASVIFNAEWLGGVQGSTVGLVLGAATLFFVQTTLVAGIVAVSEGKPPGSVWLSLSRLLFPYYVLSAGVTSMLQTMISHVGWGLAFGVLPTMYGIYWSYRLYFGRLAQGFRPEVLVRTASAGGLSVTI